MSRLRALVPAFTARVLGTRRTWRREHASAAGADELPLRAELFTVAQLEQHARTLAGWHEVAKGHSGRGNRLLERLDANEAALRDAYRLIADAVERGRKITPAAEWLLDNYHLVEEQIRTARLHLPRGYSRELPLLANTPSSGTPRVYDLVHELISHSHGRVDLASLRAFVHAYQQVQPLLLGELWAIPIMLRLALLENLRRVAANITAGRRERELAGDWAERLLEVATSDPSSVVLVLAELVREQLPLTDPFVSELVGRLQGQGSSLAFPTTWLEQRLAEQGQTIEHVFARVSQDQAAGQVAISNSIGSLRSLGAIDWRDFVEGASGVERELVKDPAGVYSSMDFGTRDRYRHVVESVARRCSRSEAEVAQLAIGLATNDAARNHVGWFLVGGGRSRLEHAAGVRHPVWASLRRRSRALALPLYLGAIAGLTALLTWWWSLLLPLAGVAVAVRVAAFVLLALGSSQLAVALVHWVVTAWVRPTLLPRLDFSSGIPDEHRTLVAVPFLLGNAADVDEQLETLEVRFLANRDANLAFALLSDFRDAPEERQPTDEALLQRAVLGIEALVRKHGPNFWLLHRARRYNARDRTWMGWERKRGKLEQLNDALRGDASGFDTIVGGLEPLQSVRYVIVLDADTMLPRDSARMLAATIAHPLHRPRFDPERGRVTEGYAILQPRVGVTMESAAQSRFAALFGGEPGIDPYTRAVSDVYQDLFAEGSFVGKGIYDVDAVRRALAGRLPENRVLSHDLLEGAYGRAGLVSDVMLFEHYPSAYGADVSRRHRWMRGDWQLTPWLGWHVPSPTLGKPRASNPITALSRWKILDNLRRTLVPIAVLVLLFGGWLVPGAALATTLIVLAIWLVPGLLAALTALLRAPDEVPWGPYAGGVLRTLGRQLVREAVGVASLPHDAWLGTDAILRTGARVWVTGRNLLEWRTAADAQRSAKDDVVASYAATWISPTLAIGGTIALALLQPRALFVAAPLFVAWIAAPAITWWLSRPLPRKRHALADAELVFLGALARRTWHFFERWVTAEDNWLPPDNFQEDPPRGVAHRTSPTNIGLSLTANLAAYDFGYVDAGVVLERTRSTFATLDRLGRHRGHFFNWYDTISLEPLAPTYISTVDSGNLSAHLLVLATGLEQLREDPLVRVELFDGLAHAVQVIATIVPLGEPEETLRATLQRIAAEPPRTLRALRNELLALQPELAALEAAGRGKPELEDWLDTLVAQHKGALAAVDHVAPWLSMPEQQPELELDALVSVAALERRTTELDAALVPGPLRDAVLLGLRRARARLHAIEELSERARTFADAEYDFLYDRDRRLFSIGYNVGDHRLDASFYDLLASEARLASYVAIAYGKLPQEHWFSLGRMLTTTQGHAALVSWSGSMFEYLMPLLVMPSYDGTLLDETYRAVVARQIEYGREHSVAWGVSESGYAKTDAQLNYQYQAFGVPGLGFKRGLGDELVIAPYATVMAAMVEPRAAVQNLQRLVREGQLGACGLYEAIDHTAARMPPRKTSVTVRSYMAHHQGMSLLSLVYLLRDRPMQRRFLADPALRATELLLQERVPRTSAIFPHPAETTKVREGGGDEGNELRAFDSPSTPSPELHLLSNGRYHVMVTNAGGGYSRWGELAITRWREDPTRDAWGTFGYLRDVDSGELWSIAHQPTLQRATRYSAIFSHGRAEFRRRDGEIETHVELAVSPEDDAELRRVSITNHGNDPRTIELTSYAEVVLATPAADVAHPVFSNLFVQTELLEDQEALLCTRRPRSASERPPWMFHLMTVAGTRAGATSFESSRAAFIGRNRSLADPIAMDQPQLGNGVGAVLDPIVAVRNAVVLQPHETARLQIFTGVSETRDGALAMVERYGDLHSADRLLELAFTHSQVEQRRLGVSDRETQLYDRLASSVLYLDPRLRAPRGVIARNIHGQAALWAYGISGDLPMVLVRIGDVARIDLVRQAVKAHAYWRSKGLVVDLLIWNEDPSGYRQELQEQILAAIGPLGEVNLLDRPGGIFVRRSEQLSELDSVLIQTLARVILDDDAGSFAEQVERRVVRSDLPARLLPGSERRQLAPAKRAATIATTTPTFQRPDLSAFNGIGGFTGDGREYVITTQRGAPTPAPWSNVMANAWFGSVVTDSGGGYTWCENAHGYRLTPWHNDPVTDASGEVMWLRDEVDGQLWSPTLLPSGDDRPYVTRHGFGYTVFEHTTADGITTELTTFVASDAPIKFMLLKVRNGSGRARRLSATAYLELVLGAQRPATTPHIVTESDPRSGALLARNSYDAEFSQRIAFLDASEEQRSVTGDRNEVLGRNNGTANPACMQRVRLSGRVGAGYDPCLTMQIPIELADGQEREIAFTFGSGRDHADALHLVSRFRGTGAAHRALEEVWAQWGRILGTVHVRTPDPQLDFLANGWLVYQVLASRLWGRTGFYQSGGAFGFRDQLQDAMALVHAAPELLRDQLLRCAARQFRSGDVQHWWHPPLGRGVRTRISDDYLWLPYATCRYVATIGDTGVLEERLPFIDGRAVKTDEDSYYDLPVQSEEHATLYEHCVRAIEHGLRVGTHGLPLMGTGDWNDGMNLVGDDGRGESVWLAFFLHDVLVQFAELARSRNDDAQVTKCTEHARSLAAAIERHGWDGAWYRRAYFDDGTPLGSASNEECSIDGLPQSWAALAKVGDPARTRQALDSLEQRLVEPELDIVKVLDPPFDHSSAEPGYIKGYVPGVRENGGQYTHAAVWAAMAFAAVGDAERAWKLFRMIQPIHHGDSSERIATYKVEPYVVAADVYTNPQHAGRGGWTWYTGSAGWMYRLVTESLLGVRLEVDRLRIVPIPAPGWDGYEVHYRYRETFYHIRVNLLGGSEVTRVRCDDVDQPDKTIPLVDDRREHNCEVDVG